ncbi:hypothetical protein [Pontibacter chitinilyticus]
MQRRLSLYFILHQPVYTFVFGSRESQTRFYTSSQVNTRASQVM